MVKPAIPVRCVNFLCVFAVHVRFTAPSSTLIIQGTELNNGTLVTCVEYLASGIEREKKEFLVYGKSF